MVPKMIKIGNAGSRIIYCIVTLHSRMETIESPAAILYQLTFVSHTDVRIAINRSQNIHT